MIDILSEITAWQHIWPFLALAAILALISGILGYLFARKINAELIGFVFTVSVVGGIVGQMTGQSREAAVDSVVPAVLSILGTMFAYLWSTGKIDKRTIPVAGAAVALALSLFVGASRGAQVRTTWDQYWKNYYESYAYLYDQEITQYRLAVLKLVHERRLAEIQRRYAKQDAEKAEKPDAEE